MPRKAKYGSESFLETRSIPAFHDRPLRYKSKVGHCTSSLGKGEKQNLHSSTRARVVLLFSDWRGRYKLPSSSWRPRPSTPKRVPQCWRWPFANPEEPASLPKSKFFAVQQSRSRPRCRDCPLPSSRSPALAPMQALKRNPCSNRLIAASRVLGALPDSCLRTDYCPLQAGYCFRIARYPNAIAL
jgi:hypothetical protein